MILIAVCSSDSLVTGRLSQLKIVRSPVPYHSVRFVYVLLFVAITANGPLYRFVSPYVVECVFEFSDKNLVEVVHYVYS